ELVAHVDEREEGGRRVQRALANFDLAGIHTIHGFCQRALVDAAFESAMPFESELVPDVRALLQEVVDDFWRRRVVDAPLLFVQHLLDQAMTPETLAAGVAPHVGRPDLQVVELDDAADDAALEADCLRAWRHLRAIWREARAEVEELLSSPGL